MSEKQTPKGKEPAKEDTSNTNTEELDMSDTRHPKHAHMSWTACYDDYCYIHKSDKDGSGWYPKKPRRQANMHVRVRDPEVISSNEERTVVSTKHWRQVQNDQEDRPYGTIIHDNKAEEQPIELHAVIWHSPTEELEDSSEEELGKLIDEHTAYVDKLAQEVKNEANQAKRRQPATSTLKWSLTEILIETDQWFCSKCAGSQQLKKPGHCICKLYGVRIYDPRAPHTGLHDVIHAQILGNNAVQKDGQGRTVATYPLAKLKEIPHTGRKPRWEIITPEDNEDSEYSSSEGEVSEPEECPTTSIVGWSKDRLIVRTNRWFRD